MSDDSITARGAPHLGASAASRAIAGEIARVTKVVESAGIKPE